MFTLTNFLHPLNILCIFLTFLVSKFEISMLVNDEQFKNIFSIVVTLEVLKFETSMLVNDEQL